MFTRNRKNNYALLIDIGSGSVGLAICHSGSKQKPNVVWSHREHIPLRHIDSLSQSSKAIVTTLMNSVMLFEQHGRTALAEYQSDATITTVQATVAAPWSYTTTRSISFSQEEPFEITTSLVNDLALAAGQQTIDEFNQEHSLESLGVTETGRCVLDTYANGYRLSSLNKQRANEITLTHATSLIRNEIVDAVTEMTQKLFTQTELRITSFMLANYFTTRHLKPHVYDMCLVDITDEATEIGIVRDGALLYSTHSPYGRSSLAREIATVTNVPLHEAFSSFPAKDSIETNPDLQQIFTTYTAKIQDLFTQTGDRLTIPRNLYIQVSAGLEQTMPPIIQEAAEAVTKSNVQVTLTNKALEQPKKLGEGDIALLIAASFFHTNSKRDHFEYL